VRKIFTVRAKKTSPLLSGREEVGERVFVDRNRHFDNAMYTIIVSLGGVESDDNDNIEEHNSSDTQNEKLMSSHYSQEATGERGK
jgi:hypothetical protein